MKTTWKKPFGPENDHRSRSCRRVGLAVILVIMALTLCGCQTESKVTGGHFEKIETWVKGDVLGPEMELMRDTVTGVVYLRYGRGGISPYVMRDRYGQPTVGVWDEKTGKIIPAELDEEAILQEEMLLEEQPNDGGGTVGTQGNETDAADAGNGATADDFEETMDPEAYDDSDLLFLLPVQMNMMEYSGKAF